jgi:hypothetical protein
MAIGQAFHDSAIYIPESILELHVESRILSSAIVCPFSVSDSWFGRRFLDIFVARLCQCSHAGHSSYSPSSRRDPVQRLLSLP